ncbi:MAG TPA: hypothetical protein VJS88_04050 [Chthoniobacterales bacterium]|nr:hypothetical protein [Chthoniobacterales bacterium]
MRSRAKDPAYPRAALFITVLLSFGVSAQARTGKLKNGTSPDGRYRVEVVETGTPPQITYDLLRRQDGALLHRFESSYQPQPGELRDWAWHHSTDANIDWSSDSRHFSIDEQVHHYIGEVLLAEISSRGARQIKLPERAIVAATKRRWDRQRIRHRRGWITADMLSLVLAGLEASSYRSWYFEAILRIRGGKAEVISCRDVTNEP